MMNPEDLRKLVEFSSNLKVLYVEDSIVAREQALKLLSNFFKDISVAVDGKDGLKKSNENNFDLIFTDLNMPNMNGMDMIYEIRRKNKDIIIIVISAHNESIFKEGVKKYNIHDYITKPICLDNFMETLESIIDKIKTKKNN